MQNFKVAVRRAFYKRRIDTLLLALYLYLLAAILMSVSGIDLTDLVWETLLPDQTRFRAIWTRNATLDYAPSLFFGLLVLYPPALLATLAQFRRVFTWTIPTKTQWEYYRLSAGAAFLGVLLPLLLLFVFDDEGDRMRRRGRGLMELVALSDLTLAIAFALTFWGSAVFIAGAHYFYKLGREA